MGAGTEPYSPADATEAGAGDAPASPRRAFDANRHCGATTKQTGRPCANPKGFRTDHVAAGRCYLHGGTSPTGKKHAEAEVDALNRARAAESLKKLGVPIQADPQQALLEQVWEAAGNVAYLRGQVQALPAVYGPDHFGDGRPHVVVTMYAEERDRLAKISKMAIDAGVSQALVSIASRQVDALEAVLEAVFAYLGVTPEQREGARQVAGTKLMVLVGGKAAA